CHAPRSREFRRRASSRVRGATVINSHDADAYKTSPAQNAGLRNQPKDLFDVSGDELGHLEHADLALTVEHGPERIVGIDHRPLFLILATVLLDVVPELLGEFGAWDRFRADDRGEFIIGLHRPHE